MSSTAVRDAARDLENAAGWPPALPYLDTLSDAPNPATLPDSWFTLLFQGQTDDPIGIGPTAELRETGNVILACLGRSGTGDDALITLVETASPLIGPHFKTASIYVRSVSPPQDAEPNVDGEWLRLDLTVEYQRDHV